MRLYVDDLRTTGDRTKTGPNAPWERTYGYHDTVARLSKGDVTHISLDHDLGPHGTPTGYDIAKWIEEQAHAGALPPMTWEVHSMNVPGSVRIKQAMRNADRYWGKNSPM